jgi:predicted metal-dependent enzyme (double-stranded beta helix superfamily)
MVKTAVHSQRLCHSTFASPVRLDGAHYETHWRIQKRRRGERDDARARATTEISDGAPHSIANVAPSHSTFASPVRLDGAHYETRWRIQKRRRGERDDARARATTEISDGAPHSLANAAPPHSTFASPVRLDGAHYETHWRIQKRRRRERRRRASVAQTIDCRGVETTASPPPTAHITYVHVPCCPCTERVRCGCGVAAHPLQCLPLVPAQSHVLT